MWIRIASASDCPPGSAREHVVEGKIVALFNVAGEFFALDGLCPHQGGPLGKGRLQGCIVSCPWHGFAFDVRTGLHQASQSLQQKQYPVKQEEGQLWIDLDGAPAA